MSVYDYQCVSVRVSVINTVYLVFSTMEKSKMSLFGFFSSSSLWTLHTTCGRLQMTMPESGLFSFRSFFFSLATAECDFTEREAAWTGFCTG